jgi:hypothetical protein
MTGCSGVVLAAELLCGARLGVRDRVLLTDRGWLRPPSPGMHPFPSPAPWSHSRGQPPVPLTDDVARSISIAPNRCQIRRQVPGVVPVAMIGTKRGIAARACWIVLDREGRPGVTCEAAEDGAIRGVSGLPVLGPIDDEEPTGSPDAMAGPPLCTRESGDWTAERQIRRHAPPFEKQPG